MKAEAADGHTSKLSTIAGYRRRRRVQSHDYTAPAIAKSVSVTSLPTPEREHRPAMTTIRCLMVLAPTALAGVALGGGACAILDLPLQAPSAWALLGVGALLPVGVGAMMLHWVVIRPHVMAAQVATAGQVFATTRLEANRRLRHDIRSALSPALLTADRLLTHTDPAVQRAGNIMVTAVERAADLLLDPMLVPTPLAHP